MRPTHGKPIDAEKAQRFLSGLREGKTLHVLCSGKMNGKRVSSEIIATHLRFREYCAENPDFAREANALLAKNTKAADARKGDRLRNLTHCKRGHPFSGSNVRFMADGYRKCRACEKDRHPLAPSEEHIQQVTAALNAGKTISEICFGKVGGQKVGPRIMTFARLKVYRDLKPEYDRFVCSMVSGNADRARRRPRAKIILPCQTYVITPERAEYNQIANLVPHNLPRDVRDDIIQSIFLAIIEGRLQRDQVQAHARQFIRDHYRDANRHGVGKFGLISLDAPIFADSTMTRGDTIVRGLWD